MGGDCYMGSALNAYLPDGGGMGVMVRGFAVWGFGFRVWGLGLG